MRRVFTGLAISLVTLACGSQSTSWEPFAPGATGSIVSGRVIDAATSAPLPNVLLSANLGFDTAGVEGGSTHTDAQGAYVFQNRRPGPFRIEALVAGYDPLQQTVNVTHDMTLEFALTKDVAPTYTLSGRVTDIGTGVPLSGASLDVFGDKNGNRSTTTGPDGSYRFPGLLIEGFTLRARYPGYDSEFRGVQRSADSTLDIQLRPAMQSLSGSWSGTMSYTPDGAAARNGPYSIQLAQGGSALSGGSPATQSGDGFDGSIRDQSAIGSTTTVTGTLRINYSQVNGRATAVQCVGSGAFTGTVNWTQLVITAPQVVFSCIPPYTNVTLALARLN